MSAAEWLQVVWEGWFKGEGSRFQNERQLPRQHFTFGLWKVENRSDVSIRGGSPNPIHTLREIF